MAIDPYRTLGLMPGASTAEIKQAYRRLAKEHHPDTAGESAVPRFLAIRAAYDALIAPDGRRRLGGARRAAGRGTTAPDADPGGGARPRWAGQPGAGGAAPPRGRSGAAAGAAGDGAGGGPAARGSPGGTSRTGRRRTAPDGSSVGSAGRGAGRTSGPGDRVDPRESSGRGADAPRSRRQRPLRKATLGSTSYDEADREPFDPEWEGGSWYGTTSGTYWTINPKEYADPRKHGPEYQARARRRARDEAERDADAPQPDVEDAEASAPPVGQATWSDAGTTDAGGPAWSARPAGAADDLDGRSAPPSFDSGPEDAELAGEGHGLAASVASAARTFSVDDLTALLLDPHPSLARRAFAALLGWPPIGLAVAWIVGEATGCARFAASCNVADPSPTVGVLAAQVAIIVALLAVPGLGRTAVGGTLGVLVAAIPIAATLSAIGGAATPRAAADVLGWLLVLAWIVGVTVVVRLRPGRPASRPGPDARVRSRR